MEQHSALLQIGKAICLSSEDSILLGHLLLEALEFGLVLGLLRC